MTVTHIRIGGVFESAFVILVGDDDKRPVPTSYNDLLSLITLDLMRIIVVRRHYIVYVLYPGWE